MMKRLSGLGLLLLASCSEEVGGDKAGAKPQADAAFDSGEELQIPVPATGRVFVKLASPPALVTPSDPKNDPSWDLAFEGLDVFTNSGPSGDGKGAAFGPLDQTTFLGDVAPQVPFMVLDKTGGAFIQWYLYSGAPAHALYSRYHVFGVKDGNKVYRVQVLGYYAKRDGTAVPALYRVRYGEVGQPTQDVVDLDGRAGGTTNDPEAKTECLDLGTGARTMFTVAEAKASLAWHLCFRRQDISVNGGLAGERGVSAVDLEANKNVDETLEGVSVLTPESELARFEGVTAERFEGQTFRVDGVVSAFTALWTQERSNPVAPGSGVWLVASGNGEKKYLAGFSRFDGATATAPGTIVMRVKAVQ